MPIYKIYRNLDQMVLGRPEPLARPGAFKQSGHFLWCTIFGKAQKLSVCHKLVKCYCKFQDKFQLTALLICLFRLDRHRNEKSGRKWSAIDDSDHDANFRQNCHWRQRSLPSCSKIRSKTLSDRRQRSLSDHCHCTAKQVLLVWYRQRVLGSLPRIPEVALPLRSVDNKAAILSYPKGQSIIRWYYELNQGVNHEHSCVFKIWSDQELNSWPIHLAGQHCDYSTLSGIAIHSHVVNFLFKGNDLRLICMQTAPAII